MLLRFEHYSTADDRGILKKGVAPALHLTGSTETPIELPGHAQPYVLIVRALKGNALIQIDYGRDAADYPADRGRLLLEGESERFLVPAPECFLMVHEWDGELDSVLACGSIASKSALLRLPLL